MSWVATWHGISLLLLLHGSIFGWQLKAGTGSIIKLCTIVIKQEAREETVAGYRNWLWKYNAELKTEINGHLSCSQLLFIQHLTRSVRMLISALSVSMSKADIIWTWDRLGLLLLDMITMGSYHMVIWLVWYVESGSCGLPKIGL